MAVEGLGMSSPTQTGSQDRVHKIAYTTQVECGQGHVEISGSHQIRIIPKKEMLETQNELLVGGYNLCVQFANSGLEAASLDITVDLRDWFTEDWCRLPLRLPYWRRRAGSRDWLEADPGQFNTDEGVHLTLTLESEEVCVLATIPHFTYTDCCRELRHLSQNSDGLAHVVEIGRSLESRAILALELGEKRASKRVVIVGSTRPAEPSAWGLLAMARDLIKDPRLAPLLEDVQVCLLPQPNPDGIVHGRCYGNAQGLPLGSEWVLPHGQRSPETAAVWNYLSAHPPTLIGQFEFAPATTRLTDWPRPLAVDMYNQASVEIHRRLAALSGEFGLFAKDRRDPASFQLSHRAAMEFDCAAFAYRFVGPVTSPSRAEHRARQVLRIALEALRVYS